MDISRIEIVINPDDLTLDDLELFEPGGFSIRRLRAFLARVTTLSPDEIGQIRLRDLRSIAERIGEAIRDVVPKATSSVSRDGPGDATISRSGPPASPGQNASAASRSG